MDEALDLALGLGPIRAAQSRQKAVVVGKVAEPGLQPVLARAIRVTADHHGAHVVVKHLVRRAADERKRRLVARRQRLEPLVGDELHVGRPAIASTATNTESGSAPRRITAQSTCI